MSGVARKDVAEGFVPPKGCINRRMSGVARKLGFVVCTQDEPRARAGWMHYCFPFRHKCESACQVMAFECCLLGMLGPCNQQDAAQVGQVGLLRSVMLFLEGRMVVLDMT
jgi:hypothetical protein